MAGQVKTDIINRMVQLMRTFYVKIDERIADLHHIKFRFENSMQFEEGYLMSVIIEKYRQAVAHCKYANKQQAMPLPDLIVQLELVQRVYIDTYRMVNMMHEIPRKYGFDIRKRPSQIIKGDPEDLVRAIKSLKVRDVNKKKQRRKRLKDLKKIREEMELAGNNLTMTPRAPHNTRQYWEFQEYGWELDEEYRNLW